MRGPSQQWTTDRPGQSGSFPAFLRDRERFRGFERHASVLSNEQHNAKERCSLLLWLNKSALSRRAEDTNGIKTIRSPGRIANRSAPSRTGEEAFISPGETPRSPPETGIESDNEREPRAAAGVPTVPTAKTRSRRLHAGVHRRPRAESSAPRRLPGSGAGDDFGDSGIQRTGRCPPARGDSPRVASR